MPKSTYICMCRMCVCVCVGGGFSHWQPRWMSNAWPISVVCTLEE